MAVTIDQLQIDIQAKGAESASGIDKLTTSLGALKSMINKSLVGKLESLSSALNGIKAPITVNMNVKGMEGLRNAVQAATAGMPTNSANISPTVDGSAVTSEMNRIKASTEQAADGFTTITSEATRAKQELKSAGDAAGGAGKKLKEVGTSAKQGASGLSKFVSSLKRILMYRVVRSILSNIARAAKEGIQNLVQYSAAIGGIDASRANATMSQFASIGMQVKNTIGAAVMPVLNALMPVIQTVANWFIIAANAVNQFFAAITGASTWTKAKEYAVDYADGIDQASGSVAKLKGLLAGFDEINIIQSDSGGGGGGAGGLDYGDMFEEIPINQNLADLALKIKDIFFDWEDLTLNDIIDKIVVGLGIVTGAMIGWSVGGFGGAVIGAVIGAGLGLAFTELLPDFENLSAKDIQDLIIAGIGGLIGAIVGWKFGGLTGALIGLSIGASITLVLENLKWDDMSTGEKIGTVAAVLGGLVLSLGAIAKLKGLSDAGKAAEAAETIDTAVGELSPKLSSLAKNLGMGLVIIAEVAAAAILITGAIWVLGKELEQVGLAWQPVIDNGATIAIAVGIGTGILVAIGAAAYGLGTLGTTVALNIGIGIAILAELGIAAGLFIAEIRAIGRGLEQVGIAWQPVLDNGETIATGIGLGTALLVGIGVVTAALGAATVASAGLLPLAIGLGTAILVELAAAFILFTGSLVAVADELSDNLSPSLSKLNRKLPKLKTDMSDFTDYMVKLASEISSYKDSMGSITWSKIAGDFQKLFAGSPIKTLADDVSDIADDTSDLNDELNIANPELETAVDLLTDYSALMSQMKVLTDENGTIELATGLFTNLKTAGEKLVTGLATGMNAKISLVTTESQNIAKAISSGITDNAYLVTNSMNTLLNALLTKMETFTNRCREALNLMLRDFSSSMASVYVSSRGKVVYSGINAQYISQFASGGYPTTGQLFIANEARELVGSMGGRTAVANNDQITAGIYNAVLQAMIDGGGNGNQTIQIDVDGDTVYNVVVNKDRQRVKQTGRSAFAY